MPTLSSYILQENFLARGFSSTVYKGTDKTSHQQVAIKRIDESVLESQYKKKMLSNELSIQWQLKGHPNIVEIKAQFYQDDSIYIVTEFCQNGDLKNKIRQNGPLAEAIAVSYMMDIIGGFAAMLKHGIIHRDIRSVNILIAKNAVKIGDFGYAYKVHEGSSQQKDDSGHNVGSPSYMAPQVLRDAKNSSHLSDVWSIGVVFFQTVTGKLPFIAKCKETLIKVIQYTGIRSIIPEDLSLKSKEFILRTLKKDPQKRIKPQELIDFQFDDEILFKIKRDRERKMQELQLRKQGLVKQYEKKAQKNQQKQLNRQKLNLMEQKPKIQVSKKQFDNIEHHGKFYLDPKDISIERKKGTQEQNKNSQGNKSRVNLMLESMVELVVLESEKDEYQDQPKDQNKDTAKESVQKTLKNNKKQSNFDNYKATNPKKQSDLFHHDQDQNLHGYNQLHKEQIIDKILPQIDLIRFLSRILHKIEQIHHIHIRQHTHHQNLNYHPNDKKIPQNYVHEPSMNKANKQNDLETYPEVYIQMRLFILGKIKELERLEFLKEDERLRFVKSEEFKEIKVILDTFKSKLDLEALKTFKWKGLATFRSQIQKQILLVYNKLKFLIAHYLTHPLDPESKQMKKLSHKIQALNYMIVLKYDYLTSEGDKAISLHGNIYDKGFKNNQSYAQIQAIIEEKHKENHHNHHNHQNHHNRHNDAKTFEQNVNQLIRLEKRLQIVNLI